MTQTDPQEFLGRCGYLRSWDQRLTQEQRAEANRLMDKVRVYWGSLESAAAKRAMDAAMEEFEKRHGLTSVRVTLGAAPRDVDAADVTYVRGEG